MNEAGGKRLWICFLPIVMWMAPAHAQYTTLEVITLKYRTAEQVIPVLGPLLDRDGALSGMQNQLIIRTTPANLAQLKQVLVTLDAMPRRLLITVRRDQVNERERAVLEISGSASAGNTVLSMPASRGEPPLRGRIETGSSADYGHDMQTLQVLEGDSAFIGAGQSTPVPQRQVLVRTLVNGRIVERTVEAAEYRDATTGFYVLPRLAGDTVTLEISAQRDALAGGSGGSANVQRAATTVSGRLGEWITVGGSAEYQSGGQASGSRGTRESFRDSRGVWLKIEELR